MKVVVAEITLQFASEFRLFEIREIIIKLESDSRLELNC